MATDADREWVRTHPFKFAAILVVSLACAPCAFWIVGAIIEGPWCKGC